MRLLVRVAGRLGIEASQGSRFPQRLEAVPGAARCPMFAAISVQLPLARPAIFEGSLQEFAQWLWLDLERRTGHDTNEHSQVRHGWRGYVWFTFAAWGSIPGETISCC